MTQEEANKKKETLLEVISSIVTEELDEGAANDIQLELDHVVDLAITSYQRTDFEEEGQALVEYHGDMDSFVAEEE